MIFVRGDISPEAALAQTNRVLGNAHFSRSETLSRFLRFVSIWTLNGKQGEIKEYRLGVDVFGRGADFDPRVDPIVRMQVSTGYHLLSRRYQRELKDVFAVQEVLSRAVVKEVRP